MKKKLLASLLTVAVAVTSLYVAPLPADAGEEADETAILDDEYLDTSIIEESLEEGDAENEDLEYEDTILGDLSPAEYVSDIESHQDKTSIDYAPEEESKTPDDYVSDLKLVVDDEEHPSTLSASFKVSDKSKFYSVHLYDYTRDVAQSKAVIISEDGTCMCDLTEYIESMGQYSFKVRVDDSETASFTEEDNDKLTASSPIYNLYGVEYLSGRKFNWDNKTGILSWEYTGNGQKYIKSLTILTKWNSSDEMKPFFVTDTPVSSVDVYEILKSNPELNWNGEPLSDKQSFLFQLKTTNPFAYMDNVWTYTALGKYMWNDELENGWWAEKELRSGKKLKVRMAFSSEVEYDGRKHVVKGTQKESDKVNPDIELEEFLVVLDDEEVPGISVGGYKYKNNTNAGSGSYFCWANDSISAVYFNNNMMQIIPTMKYDKNNAELKEILKEEKDFKSALSSMIAPKTKTELSMGSGGSHKYTYFLTAPIGVYIKPLSLDDDTSIYTQAQVKADTKLKNSGGFFVYNGKTSLTFKKYTKKGENPQIRVLSGSPGALAYQFAYNIDGVIKTKQIKLRSGKMTYKWGLNDEDEIVLRGPYTMGTFDYLIDPDTLPGQDLKIYLNFKRSDMTYFDPKYDQISEYEGISGGYFNGKSIVIARDENTKQKEFTKYYPGKTFGDYGE